MKQIVNIDIHHLTRVEGHGNIIIKIEDGKLKESYWEVVETPRFFEMILKGKHYTSAGPITSRICGICSIGHCLASLRATEAAFGIVIPNTATRLRLLAKHGETLQSHYLHLLFLAAPDFLNVPSVIPLLQQAPDVVQVAARLKGLANTLCDTVTGRTTHPVSLQVGGVAVMPEKKTLRVLRDELIKSLDDLDLVLELVSTFSIPDFVRETEFISLKAEANYPFIGGALVSSDGVEKGEHEYEAMTNEYVNEKNTSKWCKLSRESFAVGALARFNNNYRYIHPNAFSMAQQLGLDPLCHNPFMNNVAQLVECVHCSYESINIIDDLLDSRETITMASVIPRAGRGIAAVEVPRGVLYHDYEYDDEGHIIKANCVIPTTQNNANIHHDIPCLIEKYQGASKEDLERLCSMLVRSYDPCISCSVH